MKWMKCAGRWSRGRCSLPLRPLPSNHALRPLLPSLCLTVAVLYSLADTLRNFVAGIFIPQYHYPYAVALCFAQVVVSLLLLNLLHLLDVVPLRRYSRSLGERVLVPAICSSVHAVLAMWVKASSSHAGLFSLTGPLLPLLTVGLSFGLKLAVPPSAHISVLVCILSGSSVVYAASRGVSGVHPLEYVYAPLAPILHAVALTWLAKVSEAERRRRAAATDAQASVFDIYYALLVNQCWTLGFLWLLHPHGPWKVLSQGSWHSLLFHGYLLAILLLGTLLNAAAGLAALWVSPLAAALLHSGRELVQPFGQLL